MEVMSREEDGVHRGYRFFLSPTTGQHLAEARFDLNTDKNRESRMDNYDSGSRGRPQERRVRRNLDDKIEYLLSAEEQLLQSISIHGPLPKILNRICSALDCQIGNVVSLISLPTDDASELADIAMSATLFGLHTFCSAGVVAENDERLGSLDMYCCVPRSPSSNEFRLIERAKCLAAIAIKLNKEADDQGSCGMRGNLASARARARMASFHEPVFKRANSPLRRKSTSASFNSATAAPTVFSVTPNGTLVCPNNAPKITATFSKRCTMRRSIPLPLQIRLL